MNATITISGVQLTASNLGLPESADWYAWYYERDIIATGGATYSPSVEQTSGGISALSANADANYILESQSAQSYVQESAVFGDSNVQISAIDDYFSIGNVSATAFTPVSASVVLSGITVNSSIYSLNANVENDEVVRLSGNPVRYSQQIANASLKLSGIRAKIDVNDINASGTVIIDAVIGLNSNVININVHKVVADGILDISEDELVLFLMAA